MFMLALVLVVELLLVLNVCVSSRVILLVLMFYVCIYVSGRFTAYIMFMLVLVLAVELLLVLNVCVGSKVTACIIVYVSV